MRKLTNIAILILITVPVSGKSVTYEDSLFSKSLGKTMSMSIIIPSTYNEKNSIPILYLLHGFGGNYKYFVNNSNINQFVEDASIICVMPQGDNSFYINSFTQPSNRYEDYLINELPAFIKDKYNIDNGNQSIAGFSMGGYGAVTLAMRHPEKFEFVASIAGAVMVPGDLEVLEALPRYKFVTPTTDKVFGEIPNSYRDEHNPFLIYKNVPREDLPYIFLFSAMQDYFSEIVEGQRDLADSLNTYRAFFEYHELQGGHDSQTVNASLHLLIQRIKYFQDNPYKSITAVLVPIVLNGSVEQAITKYHELKLRDMDEYNFNENLLNNLGYQLLGKNMVKEAIGIFKLNVKEYPYSSNSYDSLAEAYMLYGHKELAIKNYSKSLDLDSNNNNAIEMLKQLKSH